MNTKYDFEVDLTNRNNAHTLMVELVGANKRVLEVGCATGYVSKILRDRGCRVVGIELDPGAAEKAQTICEQVLIGNVEELDLTLLFPPASFDVALFGDVLEHLKNPLDTLRSVRPLLAPGGFVVISIPNIAHGAVRLALLRGKFDYTPLGLLDETHLRFFTKGGIERLLQDAGFVPVQMCRTTAGIFETEIRINQDDYSLDVIEMVMQDTDAETYQFVNKAVVDDASSAVSELYERNETQRADLVFAQSAIQKLQVELEDVIAKSVAYEHESREKIVCLQLELDHTKASLLTCQEELQNHILRWERIEKRLLVRLYRLTNEFKNTLLGRQRSPDV